MTSKSEHSKTRSTKENKDFTESEDSEYSYMSVMEEDLSLEQIARINYLEEILSQKIMTSTPKAI